MNKYLYLLVAFCVLLSVSFGAVAYHFYGEYRNEKSQKENTQLLLSDKIKEVEVYKNSYGHLVHKNEALILDNKSIKDLVKNGNLAWIKELEGVKKNIKNLEFAYKASTTVIDSLSLMLLDTTRFYVLHNDTIYFKARDWQFTDEWSNFKAIQLRPDSVNFTYKINVPLKGGMYWRRKHPFLWILSKKEYKSEIFSENPNVKITELLNIKVTKKK